MAFWTSFRRHPVRWSAVGFVTLAAFAAVLWWLRPTPVDVARLESRDLVRTFVLAGRVRPPSTATLGSSVVGTVREVRVREGDRVRRGETLVVLDDREARARLREAEAMVVEAAASSESAVEIAGAEAERAQRDLERTRAMFDEGARSEQQVEQAEQRWLEARARLEAALASAEAAGTTPASVARARAAADAAQVRLSLARIQAPADGVVLSRSVEPGDLAQPTQPLLEVAFDGPAELVAFPAEEDLEALHVGARALASADAYPDSVFDAEIFLVSPAVDPDQGTVEIRLTIADPPPYLRAFMTVSINIEAGRRDDAPVLPTGAVRDLGTDAPWVALVRDGRVERRPVDVGLVGEGWAEILSGVSASDAVIVSDEALEPGDRVRARGGD